MVFLTLRISGAFLQIANGAEPGAIPSLLGSSRRPDFSSGPRNLTATPIAQKGNENQNPLLGMPAVFRQSK